ncbi:MAG: helix-turn-helix domain-containing protein [Bacteriovoracaceae bacterium]
MKGYAIRKLLCAKLSEYQEQNKAYSLRAFAKKLGLSPTSLSLLLNGKRYPSAKMAAKICEALKLRDDEQSEMMKAYKLKNPMAGMSAEELIQEKKEVWQRELNQILGSELAQLYQIKIEKGVIDPNDLI